MLGAQWPGVGVELLLILTPQTPLSLSMSVLFSFGVHSVGGGGGFGGCLGTGGLCFSLCFLFPLWSWGAEVSNGWVC